MNFQRFAIHKTTQPGQIIIVQNQLLNIKKQLMDWKNKLDVIQNKIRSQLHARKIDDLEGVYVLMSEFDKDNSGYLDKDEFQKFLSKIGVFLTTQELRAVYDKYDLNKDGNIAYAEFINLIRENMSEKRQNVVRHAFRFLDQSGQGRISLENLYRVFQAKSHPRVRTRQKTAEQVMNEFANAISKRSHDGQTITEDEFLNFYADCNATLPNEKEEYFSDLVLSTWGVTSGADYVSPQRLAQLEIILFEKIRQKTLTKDDEGKTAKKAFQYFDLTDKGNIDIYQFAQALKKFGCVFNDREIQALFNKYDSDKSGRLCYDEICGLIALMGSGNNPNVNPVFQIAREAPVQTISRIKAELQKKGQHAIRNLGRIFTNSDKNKNGTLNRQEFQWAMKESGFSLTKTEYDNLFRYFDKNCDDEVSFTEFIGFLKVPIKPYREELIRQLFKRLNPSADGEIDINAFKASYDASKSWDVCSGRRTVQDAQREFNDLWRDTKSLKWDHFVDYFTEISALVDDDRDFEKIVKNSWK